MNSATFTEIETAAINLAEMNGRDWIDCGEYEREAYRDEASKQMGFY